MANFSSRTLQADRLPCESKHASLANLGWLSSLSWDTHELLASLQSLGCGPRRVTPVEARPASPSSGINELDLLCQLCRGGGPASPDGGQPTRAAVLKLSLARSSKASNGRNNSYLQSVRTFTVWDPTGLYNCNKLIHTLTRRRLSPTPARQPPLG